MNKLFNNPFTDINCELKFVSSKITSKYWGECTVGAKVAQFIPERIISFLELKYFLMRNE